MLKPRHIFLVLVATPVACAAQVPDPGNYVVNNVTVIDVAAGRAIPAQRVIINGSRITSIGPASSTPVQNTIVVNGAGKFLIPGLWDMHVHVASAGDARPVFALFLANGITGVRDMSTGVDGLIKWRTDVNDWRVLGPRIVGAGVLIDGTPIVYPGITHATATPDEARKIVDSLVMRGVDFIKAYEMLRPEVYVALAAAAKAKGIPYVGHLPLMVSAEDAIRMGHRSFEHLRGLEIACSSKADSLREVAKQMIEAGQSQQGMRLRSSIHQALRPRAYDTYDEAKCNGLMILMARAGAWQTPNLVLATQNSFRHDTTEFFQKWVQYLPEPFRTSMRRDPGAPAGGRGNAPTNAGLSRGTTWMMSLTKKLHDAGVKVLPGSDLPNPAMIPGASLHEELVLLVKAGLTNAEALRAGTLNPAEYLGMTDSLGTVTAGKVAELVLLDANPLDDVRNVSKVQAVWRAGRYLDRVTIDEMLARLR
jgi:imidazolonepropionase-like amidohydrolase